MKAIPIITLLTLLLSACTGNIDPAAPDGEQQAWIPVYATPATVQAIEVTTARPTLKAGKIYSYGTYVFQNELQEGVHIIDRAGTQPKKIAFLKIPFSTEIAVKGHYLYANSVSDMIVIDIANPQQPTIVKRLKDAFPPISQDYPPYNNVYFECVDHSKGIVVDWELRTVRKVTCRR